jgi:purine-binding chemotaxis protein CheW
MSDERSSQETATANAAMDCLTVVIGSQLLGIPVSEVQDVFEPQGITCVPLAPPEVGGVLNLRGRIVTIIDLRRRLSMPPRAGEQSMMAVGVEWRGESYGLLIDLVGEVIPLDAGQIEPSPENLGFAWSGLSRGVYRLRDRLLIVLDMNQLMSFDKGLRAA